MSMASMPPGGRFGMIVPGTLLKYGKGSSKIAVGWPFSTAVTKLFISSGPSDEGCTAKSTSYFSVIGCAGLTCTTSYCFCNSSMIVQLPPEPGFIGFMRPKTWASVATTPTRLRFSWVTVPSERISSYSTAVPRSMKGRVTFSSPQVTATDMKILSNDITPCCLVGTRLGSMPNRFSAKPASSLKGSALCTVTRIMPLPMAWNSRSIVSRFKRVCT